MQNQNFQFYNIAPFSPGAEKQLAQDMIEYTQRTGNRVVLYSLTLHPEGRPATKKAEYMTDSYRRLKKELEGSEVQLGILLQAVLGHWPRTDKDEEDWTRTVNIQGQEVRFCPLDPDFRKYIFAIITALARENPVFILSDDDVRSNSPIAECFCPLHTAEYNRRYGTDFTPEAYRNAVLQSGPGEIVYDRFEELRGETLRSVTALIRKAIDSVNPEIPSGTCLPFSEIRSYEQVTKCMSGCHPPVMRLCNADYMESNAKLFPSVVARTQILQEYYHDIPRLLDEADTCPHTPFSRSAASMHAKLCSSIMSGLNGAKIWYVNARKYGLPISRHYTDILAENSSLYQELTGTVKNSDWMGIAIPGLQNFTRWHFGKDISEFFLGEQNFTNMLGAYGIPFHCTFNYGEDTIYVIAGEETARRLKDEDIRSMMSRSVFLDGPAAMVLTERGFSDLMGVKAERREFLFNHEADVKTGVLFSTSRNANIPLMTVLNPQAEILTRLVYSPFTGSPVMENAAPGSVFSENRLGGKICTSCYYEAGWHLNLQRKLWLIAIFDRLRAASLPLVVLNEQNILALNRKCKDGSLLLAVCNNNFDALDFISIRSTVPCEKILRLSSEGIWENQQFSNDDAIIRLPCHLGTYDCAFFRFIPQKANS